MQKYEVLVDNFTFEGTASNKGAVIELDAAKATSLVDAGKIAASPRHS